MRASACGKLILCGEHAVVYDHPAIAIPLSLQTHVTIEDHDGMVEVEHELFSPRQEERLEEAMDLLFPKGGVLVKIEGDLPVGVGLGSSAALSVAACRAAGLGEEDLRTMAMEMERVFHGDPSGLDVAVSIRNESLWFMKGRPLRPVPTPPCAIVVLDSGMAGDTRLMVERVRSRQEDLQDILDDIGALVHAARAVLEDPISLGELLTENHSLLKQLGVSNPTLDGLVDIALAAGAHGAKLSGAGGGGVVLALTDHPDLLLRNAGAAGIDAWLARGAP